MRIAGQEVEQGGAAALQGGGGHAEGPAASQHRALLRLVGGAVAARQPQGHARHRAHDVRHAQNVRTHTRALTFLCFFV